MEVILTTYPSLGMILQAPKVCEITVSPEAMSLLVLPARRHEHLEREVALEMGIELKYQKQTHFYV